MAAMQRLLSFAAEQWTDGPHHLAALQVPRRAHRQRPVSRYCRHRLPPSPGDEISRGTARGPLVQPRRRGQIECQLLTGLDSRSRPQAAGGTFQAERPHHSRSCRSRIRPRSPCQEIAVVHGSCGPASTGVRMNDCCCRLRTGAAGPELTSKAANWLPDSSRSSVTPTLSADIVFTEAGSNHVLNPFETAVGARRPRRSVWPTAACWLCAPTLD